MLHFWSAAATTELAQFSSCLATLLSDSIQVTKSFDASILVECFLPACICLWQSNRPFAASIRLLQFTCSLVILWIISKSWITSHLIDLASFPTFDGILPFALSLFIWTRHSPKSAMLKGLLIVLWWHLVHVFIFHFLTFESSIVLYMSICLALFSMVPLGVLQQQHRIVSELAKGAEYDDVKRQVLKHISRVHYWIPEVTMIEKVVNPALVARFEAAAGRTHGKYVTKKFHGTSSSSVRAICWDGFRLPHHPGMFGKGVYFATDSSKSAQERYTKGSNKLLLCSVLLGNSKNLTFANKDLTLESLRREGFDSIFAMGGDGRGGVLHDEYVIYDPDQALPEYIIHYRKKDDCTTFS